MQGFLNTKQIEYILFHLNYIIDIQQIKEHLFFSKNNNKDINQAKIIFKLSKKKLDEQNILSINNIPILFPISKENQFFRFEKNNLIFEHDILKSAFYLLSGYQEYVCETKDKFKRFPHKNSIQNKLNFTQKPLVNYYFNIIIEGIIEFAKRNNILIQQKNIFQKPIFFLTHDIDNLHFYYYSKAFFYAKQFLGIKKSNLSKIEQFKFIFKYGIRSFIKFSSFEKLRAFETENDLKSASYFLENDTKIDSKYQYSDKYIVEIIQKLLSENCEVGVHGTFNSYNNLQKLTDLKLKLQKTTNVRDIGIRQHFLRCEAPKTQEYQAKAGYSYDTTLGFAEHEGFRNSYCLPFKLFDFENNEMIDLWEIPLTVMDGTLFNYRELNFTQAEQSIKNLKTEIEKFNGVFTLLWHNDYFDEVENKGITNFYRNTLKLLSDKFINMTGNEIINLINKK